jgi:Type IV secretion-system coupling protein DNA-binding domain
MTASKADFLIPAHAGRASSKLLSPPLLMRSPPEQGGTARFASRLIGERETLRIHESHSRKPGEWQSSKTMSEHRVTESAVLPIEIEQLPDLAGYLKLASSPSWRRVNITRP